VLGRIFGRYDVGGLPTPATRALDFSGVRAIELIYDNVLYDTPQTSGVKEQLAEKRGVV